MLIEFVIDQEGQVRNPIAIRANNPWFERPAIDAVLQWRFTPGEKDGRKVATRVSQMIQFRLDNGQATTLWKVKDRNAQDAMPPEMRWDEPPEPIGTAYPVYPFEDLLAGRKGRAKIIYLIDQKGEVVESKVTEATTPGMGLAIAAMMETWRFNPARKKDGTAVATVFAMEYEFMPDGRGSVPVSSMAREILRDLEKKPGSIVTPQELDRPLKPISCRPPAYPRAREKAEQAGEATIEFLVDREGDAQLPRIVSSSAPEFGYAAAQAVATWRYEAPKKSGKSVVVRTQAVIAFPPSGQKTAAEK